MTSETHITHETARLLKRAGFDWLCERRYIEGRPVRSYPPKDHNKQSGQSPRPAPDICSMPTQAVAARWLREVKGVYIQVDVRYKTQNGAEYIYEPVLFPCFNGYGGELQDRVEALCHSPLFYTYETALEHGLREVLHILISSNTVSGADSARLQTHSKTPA